MTEQNICQLVAEISKARKKKINLVKGKGKCILILSKESDDEDKLHTRAGEILKDATKSNISVKTNSKISSKKKQRIQEKRR